VTRTSLLPLLLLASCMGPCRPDGDHCEVNHKRCEGNFMLVCQQAGAKPDLLTNHKSNYYDRTECPVGTQCIQVDSDIGCADPATKCDPTTKPVVKTSGLTIEIKSCTNMINTNGYLETATYTTCDPKTFTPKCLDGQSALNCLLGDTLPGEKVVIREALRGKHVEYRTVCAVCGADPTSCNN
jgi:hypothetical protein